MSQPAERADHYPAPGERSVDVDLKSLAEAFELFTRTTQTMEESYRRLERRLESLDKELAAKNESLEITTDYLNSILDSMSDGVIAIDTGGAITTFNRAAAEVLGYAPSEVLGRRFDEIFEREFNIQDAGPIAELRGKSGRAAPVSERDAPVALSTDGVIGTVKVFQDLREVEALREQVRRKDRLAAIGEMAATVAHEIRNPLGGVRGFAVLLQRDLAPDDPRSRLVEKILTGTKNLERVVNEILEYTRPVELVLREIPLATLVDGVTGLVEPGPRRIRVTNAVAPGVMVTVDTDKFRQVLLNILINAVQSIENEGAITVNSHDEDGTVAVTIEDTGCGIPEDQLAQVFSPFYSTKEKGTGLGLAVALKIVESHGGTMEISSKPPLGTVVHIRLPKRKQ